MEEKQQQAPTKKILLLVDMYVYSLINEK